MRESARLDELRARARRSPPDPELWDEFLVEAARAGRLAGEVRWLREELERRARCPAGERAFLRAVWRAGFGLGDPYLQFPGRVMEQLGEPRDARIVVRTEVGGAWVLHGAERALEVRLAPGRRVDRVARGPGGAPVVALVGGEPASVEVVAWYPGEGAPRRGVRVPTGGLARPIARAMGPDLRRLVLEGEGPALAMLELAPWREGMPEPVPERIRTAPHPGAAHRVTEAVIADGFDRALVETRGPGAGGGEAWSYWLVDFEAGTLDPLPGRFPDRLAWRWSPDGLHAIGQGVSVESRSHPWFNWDPDDFFHPFAWICDARRRSFRRVDDPRVFVGPVRLLADGRLAGEADPPRTPEFSGERPPELFPAALRVVADGFGLENRPGPAAPPAGDPRPARILGPVDYLEVGAGGSALLVGAPQEAPILWGLDEGLPLRTFEFRRPYAVALARAAPRLAQIVEAKQVDLVELPGLGVLLQRRIPGRFGPYPTAVGLSPDGERLVVGTSKGGLIVYPARVNGRARRVGTLPGSLRIEACGFLASQEAVWALTNPAGLWILAFPSGSVLAQDPLAVEPRPAADTLRPISHPGRDAVVLAAGGRARVLEVGRKEPGDLLPGIEVAAIALAPDGTEAAVYTPEGALELWTLGREPVRTLRLTEDLAPVRALAYSADGKSVLYGQSTHVRMLARPGPCAGTMPGRRPGASPGRTRRRRWSLAPGSAPARSSP